MIFVFIGMPGSGKGTQALKLVKKLGLEHISLGDILRNYAKKDNESEIGKKVKNLVDKGGLISDEIVNQIIFDSIKNCKGEKIILDGYPRTIEQLHFLEKNFSNRGITIIYFNVEKDKLLGRLLNRIICNDCGKIFSESDLEGLNYICDECNSKNLIKRNDDDKATISKRMEIYNRQTYPIIEDVRKNYKPYISFSEIDGDDSVENISKILCDTVKTH